MITWHEAFIHQNEANAVPWQVLIRKEFIKMLWSGTSRESDATFFLILKRFTNRKHRVFFCPLPKLFFGVSVKYYRIIHQGVVLNQEKPSLRMSSSAAFGP